jgi:DNA-binding winged helix-turn-helix (wHTH) protein
VVDILTYLLQHRDRVVTKHELLDRLWLGRVVGEGILAQRLMTIRNSIGNSGRSQHCIKTVHGRGYRFAASVEVHPSADSFAPFAASSPHCVDVSGQNARTLGPASLFNRPAHFVGRDAELAELAL